MAAVKRELGGWLVWLGALLLAWLLPGALWKSAQPPPFPTHALAPALLVVLLMLFLTPLIAWIGGPLLSERRSLALLEAPPGLLWAGLLLALWPSAWGPPGIAALVLAFLLSILPEDVRWLSQALPGEHPFPDAWGTRVRRRCRGRALMHLLPRWVALRIPLWLTATLVLERVLGVAGLGSDWMDRVARRDHVGMALWVMLLAVAWWAGRRMDAVRA